MKSEFQRWETVFVTWVDSGSHDSWMSEDEIPMEIPLCHTSGFYYKQTDEIIAIAGSRDTASDNVCNVMVIPLVAIKSIKKVEDEQSKAVSKKSSGKAKGVSSKRTVSPTKK
jgi:hypothetical protein